MKMHAAFETLMTDLANFVEVVDDGTGNDAPPGASFWFDGAEFALVYVREPVERLTVYSKFGELRPDAPVDDYMRLLETNLLLARSCGGAFGAFGSVGTAREVVYAFHVPMQGLSTPLLLDALRHTAVQAKAWRLASHPARDGMFSAPPASLRRVAEYPNPGHRRLPNWAVGALAL